MNLEVCVLLERIAFQLVLLDALDRFTAFDALVEVDQAVDVVRITLVREENIGEIHS